MDSEHVVLLENFLPSDCTIFVSAHLLGGKFLEAFSPGSGKNVVAPCEMSGYDGSALNAATGVG
jgi:hypothetical protein